MRKTIYFLLTVSGICSSILLKGAPSDVLLPRAAAPAKQIWTVPITTLDNDLRGTFSTLQGQIAQQGGEEQLYLTFSDGQYRKYLGIIERDYGVTVLDGWAPMEVLKRLSRYADGYILYDKANPDSIQIATMMASYMRGVIVEKQHESLVLATTGWGKLADTSAMSLVTYLSKPIPELNISAPAIQGDEFTYELRDFLVMARSPINWMTADALTDYFPDWIQGGSDDQLPGRPVFGWGVIPSIGSTTGRGEGEAIRLFSQKGFYNIPASSQYNLSVLSAYDPPAPLKQKPSTVSAVTDTNTHLVTFILTDGDNASYVLKSMMTGSNWYGNEEGEGENNIRGKIPMGWGIAPALGELAAPAVQWIYERAANNGVNRDYFVAGPSGLGYCNPTYFPNLQSVATQAERLATAMEKMDLKYVQIIDWNVYDRTGAGIAISPYRWSDLKYRDRWAEYLKHDQIQGLILLDYVPYNKYAGRLSWVNDKPVASVRHMLWEGLAGCDNDSVITKLKDGAKDLTSADGYSIVIVHCWSKGVSDVKYVMDGIADDSAIKVVSPDVFFETLMLHKPPASTPDF